MTPRVNRQGHKFSAFTLALNWASRRRAFQTALTFDVEVAFAFSSMTAVGRLPRAVIIRELFT